MEIRNDCVFFSNPSFPLGGIVVFANQKRNDRTWKVELMTNDELVARAAEKHKAMRDAIIKSGETGNDFEIAFAFAVFLAEIDHRSEERQGGGHIPCMKGIQDDG